MANLPAGALAMNRSRAAFFQDSSWEERFETLIKYTQRTAVILELTGTDATHARVKNLVRQRLQECGIAPNLPRGNPPSYDSKAFLKTEDDRLDAAYLVALHYGPGGPSQAGQVQADLGQALDRRLEVYGRYCADLYGGRHAREHQPRFGFEDYLVLVQGIHARVIAVQSCRDCMGRFPYSTLLCVQVSCPFCGRLKLELRRLRSELQRRVQAHAAARQGRRSPPNGDNRGFIV